MVIEKLTHPQLRNSHWFYSKNYSDNFRGCVAMSLLYPPQFGSNKVFDPKATKISRVSLHAVIVNNNISK